MENLFGVPMGGLTIGVVASLLVFLLILAFFARRNPVLFKLGLRNIPRRRAQTVLIIVGLMLSTAIITAALALGDTVSSLIRNGALDAAWSYRHSAWSRRRLPGSGMTSSPPNRLQQS